MKAQPSGCWTWLMALLLLGAPAIAGVSEYELKAAIIYNIGKFVRWPADVASNLRLCIVGRDDFDGALDSLEGKKVQGQTILIERLPRQGMPANHCQIAFIGRSEQERVPAVLSSMTGSPVLTISDIEGFAEQGGNIELATSTGKIAFRINPAASQRAGLEIGAQLLQLATLVDDRPREPGR